MNFGWLVGKIWDYTDNWDLDYNYWFLNLYKVKGKIIFRKKDFPETKQKYIKKKFLKKNSEKKFLKKNLWKIDFQKLMVNIFGGSLNGFPNQFPNGFPNGIPQKFWTDFCEIFQTEFHKIFQMNSEKNSKHISAKFSKWIFNIFCWALRAPLLGPKSSQRLQPSLELEKSCP